MITGKNVIVPQDIQSELVSTYIENYLLATQNSGRLMLFAGEQSTEYLNNDYYGQALENSNPEYLFRIAAKAKIGVFVTPTKYLTRYGMDYPKIPYVVKLNSKIHLDRQAQDDSANKYSLNLKDLIKMKKNNNLNIVGLRCTVDFGSEYEAAMLQNAAKLVADAHENGLLAIVWAYILKDSSPHFLAEAAKMTASLGADFVKVSYSEGQEASSQNLKEAVQKAGRTKLVCAGGSVTDARKFLEKLYNQIHISGTAGNATGRNIHQKPFDEAVRFCNAISSLTLEDKSVEEAFKIYEGNN